MCRAVGDPVVPEGRRCNGKCSDPAYVAAYQRARTAAIQAGTETAEIPEFLPVSVAPERDIGTLELASQVGEALKYESEERDELLKVYGTEEQAVVALGARVAARAEQLAGITSQEVQEAWEARFNAVTDAEEELIDSDDATQAEEEAAAAAFKSVYTGQDEQTLRDLGRLADGYRAALAEVRGMGGEMAFSKAAGESAAAKLFTDAVQVYPSDWLEKSNEFGKSPATFATSGNTAAYNPKGRVPDTRVEPTIHTAYQQTHPSYVEGTELSGNTTLELMDEPPAGEEAATGNNKWFRATYWVVNNGRSGRPDSVRDERPEGEGWELHEVSGNWRRPQMWQPTTDVPTLTYMDHGATGVAGKPPGYSVAVHELSHRFEHTMVDILRLEAAFIQRRTTVNGRQEPVMGWNPVMPEIGVRKDSFVDSYIGRDYPLQDDPRRNFSAEAGVLGNAKHFGTGYEVLSMGTEALFGGSYGGFIGAGKWRADEDHRNFVLGTMAAAGKPW